MKPLNTRFASQTPSLSLKPLPTSTIKDLPYMPAASNGGQSTIDLVHFSAQRPQPSNPLHTFSTTGKFLKAMGALDDLNGEITAGTILRAAPQSSSGDRFLLIGRARTPQDLSSVEYVPHLLLEAASQGSTVTFIGDATSLLTGFNADDLPDYVSRVQGYIKLANNGKLYYGDGIQPALPGGTHRPSLNDSYVSHTTRTKWLGKLRYSDWKMVQGEIEVKPGDKICLPGQTEGNRPIFTI